MTKVQRAPTPEELAAMVRDATALPDECMEWIARLDELRLSVWDVRKTLIVLDHPQTGDDETNMVAVLSQLVFARTGALRASPEAALRVTTYLVERARADCADCADDDG